MCLHWLQESRLEKSFEVEVSLFNLSWHRRYWLVTTTVIQIPVVMQMLTQKLWLNCINKLSFHILKEA